MYRNSPGRFDGFFVYKQLEKLISRNDKETSPLAGMPDAAVNLPR